MQSHTGAIAGADDILDAAFKQSGLLRCSTLEDFFDLSRAFAWEKAPTGPNIAIVSNAGGPAVISADATVAAGLKLAQFSDETRAALHEALPRSASVLNPIDVLGDALAERYAQACEIALKSPQSDCLLIILTPQMMTQVEKTAQIVSDLSKKYAKPIFCSFMGGQLVSIGEHILNQNHIPSFQFPERAISTIGQMWKWRGLQNSFTSIASEQISPPQNPDRIKQIVEEAVKANRPALDNLEANEVVSTLGIPTPPTAAVATLEEAQNFAHSIGWPVVLKLSSSSLIHKANIGGVVTDIWNDDQLDLAWDRLTHKTSELLDDAKNHLRFQIQKDVTNGVEVIVGLKHDPTFGPVLLFGAGGQLAELVADKNLKILPVSLDQAKELVANSKVSKLLQSHPGEPSYALDKLYDLIVRLTQLVPIIPEATDIEINPVIVTHNDVWAVDTKILLAAPTPHLPAGPKFHTATVISNTVLSAKFHYLEFQSEDPLVYQPGQYISVKVAPTRINSYSVAGQTDEHHFSLLVDTSPGGPGSKFFENVKAEDKLAYLGPFGIFTLKPDDGSQHLLFLGTGTGCSPLRSIMEAALKNPAVTAPIDFYFGLRYSSDVFWQDYFQKLSSEHPNFHFNLVLSKPDESWHGQAGHITEILDKQIPDASGCSAYLCGNQKMIDESTQILLAHNCPKDRIYTEKF
jgi:NAD(P)H-flavin reductase/succinyl-CoA synthetase beta subunit